MQVGTLYTFFIVACIVVGFIAQATAQNPADTEIATAVSGDYFDQVTLFSDGRITRFTQMPIRVHISPTLKVLPYLAEIRYAMRTWEIASNGKIRFEETEVLEQADIGVTSIASGRLKLLDTPLGSAELVRLNDTRQYISHQPSVSTNSQERNRRNGVASSAVVSNQSGSRQPTADSRYPDSQFAVEVILVLESDDSIGELSQEEMRTVCLHEFGHAIGLWGHSPDDADVCHALATAQHPTHRDINTLLRLYNTPIDTPQHEIAIEVIKKELQTNPRQARTHYLLGAVYFDKGDMTLAIASFQECLGIDPNFEPARQRLIQAYQKTGQSPQAIRLVEQSVRSQQRDRSFRESADSYNYLGTLYYRQGDVGKAIQAFESALERSPHHKAAKRNLHQLLRQKAFNALERKAFDEATAYFQRAVHLDPQNATSYRLMADGYAHVSQFSKAITHYQKALEIAPDDAEARENLVQSYNNYGVTLRNNSEWDAAILAYRNALKLQPTYQLARTNLSDVLWQKANAHRQSGHATEAIGTYLELQKLHPDDTMLASLLGELYLKTRNYQAAISAFHKVYTTLPTDSQARHNLIAAYQQYAQALRNRRDYRTAVVQLRKAVDLFPTGINLRLSLAQAYQHIGKYEQARGELERILVDAPNNANARKELVNLQIRRGNALMNRKKYAAAVTVFEAIPASEKTIDMHNMIGYLYLVQNEHLSALATFETVLTKHPRNTVAYQNLLSIESQLDLVLDKAKTAAVPAPNADDISSDADVETTKPDPIAEKLSRVRCVLARCLMDRKQPKNAMEKYRQALQAKPYTPELQTLLIGTGRQLANQFRERDDGNSSETILRWVEELDNDGEETLEP
ncbi:tetratricopeptide repeat protein [Candidatus Poribacteria bacterium]|nr:tetratricopeptide repeat protein [Candidatus Poribacteria bacterium]